MGMVGCILLIGVVVNNGIVLIDYVSAFAQEAWRATKHCCLRLVTVPPDRDDCDDHHLWHGSG